MRGKRTKRTSSRLSVGIRKFPAVIRILIAAVLLLASPCEGGKRRRVATRTPRTAPPSACCFLSPRRTGRLALASPTRTAAPARCPSSDRNWTRVLSSSSSSSCLCSSKSDDGFEGSSSSEFESGVQDDDAAAAASSSRRVRRRVRGPVRRVVRHHPLAESKERRERRERLEDASTKHGRALEDPALLTDAKFVDRDDLHPLTKRALTDVMGFEQMTDVQSRTWIAAGLEGKSVLGRSRTGTGKTVAFALPVLERYIAASTQSTAGGGGRVTRNGVARGQQIGVLIVAPTRELAKQIAEEVRALLTFHNSGGAGGAQSQSRAERFPVLCLYGGTGIQRDVAVMSKRIPSVLVATPGRLRDHIDGTRVRGRKFSDLVSQTRFVVLDEADRLLDGFYKETRHIISHLPRPDKRQTLLFSATIPRKLGSVMKDVMPRDYVDIDCIDGDRGSPRRKQTPTNVRVNQSYFTLPSMEYYVRTLVSIVSGGPDLPGDATDQRKMLVFFPTARMVKFFAEFFNEGLRIPVLAIHSRMTQSARNRASSAFRRAREGAVLFTTDLSARGMDYPNVSLVVQYGAPQTELDYIHRLGRTGRAGMKGCGLLILLPFERNPASRKKRKGLSQDETILDAVESTARETDEAIRGASQLVRSGHVVLTPNAKAAYLSFLAYYVANADDDVSGEEIVRAADVLADSVGLADLPPVSGTLSEKLKQKK